MSIKAFIDKNFPFIVKRIRKKRDENKFAKSKFSKTAYGFSFIGNKNQIESRLETGEIETLKKYINETDVFIDIGANCGFYSLIASQENKTIISFEPNFENYQLFLRNIQKNNITNIEPNFLAISDKAAVLSLYGGGEGASLEKNWGGMYNTYSRLVYCNSIDNILTDRFINKRILIKIDVEGHEYNVLKGALNLFKREIAPVFLIEHGFMENFNGEINPNFLNLFNFLWENNYSSYTADNTNQKVTKEDVNNWLKNKKREFGDLNYIFIKNN